MTKKLSFNQTIVNSRLQLTFWLIPSVYLSQVCLVFNYFDLKKLFS